MLVETLIESLISLVGYSGYIGIVLLMTIESSFIPLPAELILIPAGALVARGELSFTLVLLTGTLGSILGALVNYVIAYYFGRKPLNKLIHRYGRFLLISEEGVKKSEHYFDKHGQMTTFIGRLIPGARSFISLPAGFARMPLFKFCLFTGLGAGLWNLMLIYIGYLFGDNLDLIKSNLRSITLIVLLAVGIIAFSYFIWHKRKRFTRSS